MRKEYMINVKKAPKDQSAEQDLEWLCQALGLIGPRDKEQTTMKVLRLIISASREGSGINLTDLSEQIGISKAAVMHHVNKLQERGLVLQAKRKYELRQPSIEQTIAEMERDVDQMFQRMRRISEDMDKAFGF